MHDRLVLTLLGRDVRTGLRSLSRSDVAWIVLGGGVLIAYAIADVWIGLVAQAASVRVDAGLWLVRGPAVIALIAAFCGNLAGGVSAKRALAPFLRALPITDAARWRMAAIAGRVLGAPVVALTLVAVIAAGLIVAKPLAVLWAVGEAGVAAVAFGAALLFRLRAALRPDTVIYAAPRAVQGPPLFGIGAVDRTSLPWLGSWAWGLSGGRVRLTARLALFTLVLALAAVLSIGASFAREDALPAGVVSLVGGFVVFMATVRFAPLESVMLRASPLAFGRVWRRLVRLPLMLSAAFFAVPASAATLAEPSSLPVHVQDGLGLFFLDTGYAVFAAYFAASPLTAAFSFLVAIVYAIYEASEFGGGMIIGFAALVLFLWVRTRRRFIHG